MELKKDHYYKVTDWMGESIARLVNLFEVQSGGVTYQTVHIVLAGFEEYGWVRVMANSILKPASWQEYHKEYLDVKCALAECKMDERIEELLSK